MNKTPTPASHAVNTAPISADLRGMDGAGAQSDQAGFVQWLSGTYPDAYSADEARHLWRHEHISALAWEAAKARYAAQPSRECLQQSAQVDFSLETMPAADGIAVIHAEYAKTFGRTPDAAMAETVGKVKDMLLMWWASHCEAIAAALQAAPPAPAGVAVPKEDPNGHNSSSYWRRRFQKANDELFRLTTEAQEHATQLAGQGQEDAQWLQPRDLEALERFMETVDDDQSFDIDKAAVKRLAAFGCLQNHGFGRYGITCFGSYVLDLWSGARVLPFKSQDEWHAEAIDAARAAQGGAA